MKLSDITGPVTRVTVPLGGSTMWVDFRPSAVTPQFVADIAAAERSGDPGAAALAIPAAVCTIVAAWDLQEDDGVTMVPLTVDRVARLPLPVLQAVMQATQEVATVGEASPATSAVG